MGVVLEPEARERNGAVVRMGCFPLEGFRVNEPSFVYGEVNPPSASSFLISPTAVILPSRGDLVE